MRNITGKVMARKMQKVKNHCVDCGQPCIRNACRHYEVTHYYCDKCGEEEELYEYEGQELCADCILEELPKVTESFE